MMHNTLPVSAHSSVSDDIDFQLLHAAQVYLECLQHHQTVTSESLEAGARFHLICDPILRRFAVSCHVPQDDLDDCVQEAWKEITSSLPAFQDHGELRRFFAWLLHIIRNNVADLWRYQARHPASALTPRIEAELTSRDAAPQYQEELQDLQLQVRQILAIMRSRVSETNFRVFELRWIEGKSIMDVARELHLPARQVRYRCCRMKQKFRDLFISTIGRD